MKKVKKIEVGIIYVLSIVMMLFRSLMLIWWANSDHNAPNIFEMTKNNAIIFSIMLVIDVLIFVSLTIMFVKNRSGNN